MSYLDLPRLHFFGEFIAEPSTINNDPQNYSGPIVNPGWNPNGDHRFAFANCAVVALNSTGTLVTSGDSLLHKPLTNAGGPPARIVDLDVEVQMASQVFGLTVVISDGTANSVKGTMAPASFRDFAGARFLGVYQSTLKVAPADWHVAPGSWLDGLRARSPSTLSIRFIVDLYTGLAGGAHKGRLTGVIGPAGENDALHYIAGRRLVGAGGAASAFAMLQDALLAFDVGALVGLDSTGLESIYPEISVGVKATQAGRTRNAAMKSGVGRFDAADSVPPGWKFLGTLDTTIARYRMTSGIESLSLTDPNTLALVRSSQLGLFSPQGTLLAAEADDGVFVFPDRQAIWTNPGSREDVAFMATRFGSPAAGVQIDIVPTKNAGQAGVGFPASVTTGTDGRAVATFTITDPGKPRPNMDGQIFGFGGPWAKASGINIEDAGAAIALRVFSGFTAPAAPKWDADVLPVLGPYSRFFPAMTALIDLSDFGQVSEAGDSIKRRLSLPLEDPRYMPIVRDLSDAKKQMILSWIAAGCPR